MDCVPARKISVTEANKLGMEVDDDCEWDYGFQQRRPPMIKTEKR